MQIGQEQGVGIIRYQAVITGHTEVNVYLERAGWLLEISYSYPMLVVENPDIITDYSIQEINRYEDIQGALSTFKFID